MDSFKLIGIPWSQNGFFSLTAKKVNQECAGDGFFKIVLWLLFSNKVFYLHAFIIYLNAWIVCFELLIIPKDREFAVPFEASLEVDLDQQHNPTLTTTHDYSVQLSSMEHTPR